MTHRIEELSFSLGYLLCTCKDGLAGDTPEALNEAWTAHRKANEQDSGRLGAMAGYDLVPEYVRRSRKRGGAAYALSRKRQR